ncbi:MAG: hypothetical protein KGS61_10655 [Verrucomicrobia bacterium]|nr:hypothetical protein [Verrucomicrobiota bacterium]
MTAREFRNVFAAEPFRRFTIHLADGRQVPVMQQEFAMLSPSGRSLIVYQEDDSFQVIDLMLATSVEVNGRRGKKPSRMQGD